MQTAALEASWPVMAAVKWLKTYDAMLATPLRVRDLLLGHLTWIGIRVLTVCTVFLAVMAAFGALKSPEAVFLLPAGLLTGMAFAAPIAAYAVTLERDPDDDLDHSIDDNERGLKDTVRVNPNELRPSRRIEVPAPRAASGSTLP